jgi:hypothetical protein
MSAPLVIDYTHAPTQPHLIPCTQQERDLIRLGMGMRFGQYPELANGLFLRTWRGGPHKG